MNLRLPIALPVSGGTPLPGAASSVVASGLIRFAQLANSNGTRTFETVSVSASKSVLGPRGSLIDSLARGERDASSATSLPKTLAGVDQ